MMRFPYSPLSFLQRLLYHFQLALTAEFKGAKKMITPSLLSLFTVPLKGHMNCCEFRESKSFELRTVFYKLLSLVVV